MINAIEVDWIFRESARRNEWINRNGYRRPATPAHPGALRRTLARAATRLGAWLDPAASATVTSGRQAGRAVA